METNLKELIEQSHDPKENQRNVDDIINMVTAENLCSCRDPVNMAFQVHSQKMLSVTPCRPNLSFSVDLACSKRSDSGLHRSPLSERLEQATVDLELFMMVTSSGRSKRYSGQHWI